MRYYVIDFETYFNTRTKYSLKYLSVPEYIGHQSFRVHCLGVDDGSSRTVYWGDSAVRNWLDQLGANPEPYCLVMHNAYFDAAVLAWHYDFVPARVLDTLLMANHVLGTKAEGGGSNALSALAIRLGLDPKGRLDFMDGVRDPDAAERASLESYLVRDLELCRQVFDRLMPHITNPDVELWLIDHTIKLYATRPMICNFDTVARAESLIESRRRAALDRLHRAIAGLENIEDTLASNKQFETLLTSVLQKCGEPMPTKVRATTAAERAKWAKQRARIAEASGPVPPSVVALGRRATAKWQRWSERVLETAHLVPDTLDDTVTVPALSKQDEGFVRLAYSQHEPVAALVNARLVERSSDTSRARLAKMRRVASGIGRMPVHLVYYGARTGRFSGGGGFNFQNLTSPDRTSDPGQKAIAAAIREAFEAPPGYVFVGADAAQIEARVSAWLSGQHSLLSRFARRADVYSESISEWINEEVRKPTKEEETSADPAIRQRAAGMRMYRHIGKEAVLGLGYGMGWRKFVARLKANPDMAALFTSGDLTNEFVQSIVEKYRSTNRGIVSMWQELADAFHYAAIGVRRRVGPLTFERAAPIGSRRPAVQVRLPSGRALYYRDLYRTSAEHGKYRRQEWMYGQHNKVYGGLLLENVTQAVSRDILVESIIRAELDMQVPVALHVHDSIVVLAKESDADNVLAQLIQSLRTPPEWAGTALPLDAEGKIGRTLVT
jgi:hypothetical protein